MEGGWEGGREGGWEGGRVGGWERGRESERREEKAEKEAILIIAVPKTK